jgi:catechol 2,3-dioxygenase-like lactoylglutathione lyase family enzyme
MTETTAAPAVTGFHHFSPTVSDVEASAQWYERVFGMNRVPVTFPHHGTEEDHSALRRGAPGQESWSPAAQSAARRASRAVSAIDSRIRPVRRGRGWPG